MRLKVETVTWIEANACHSLKKDIRDNIIVLKLKMILWTLTIVSTMTRVNTEFEIYFNLNVGALIDIIHVLFVNESKLNQDLF